MELAPIRRTDDGKIIAGVASGLARTLGVDATWVRIGFVLISLIWGTGLALYVALWIIMPRPSGGTLAEDGMSRAQDWYTSRKRDDQGPGAY